MNAVSIAFAAGALAESDARISAGAGIGAASAPLLTVGLSMTATSSDLDAIVDRHQPLTPLRCIVSVASGAAKAAIIVNR